VTSISAAGFKIVPQYTEPPRAGIEGRLVLTTKTDRHYSLWIRPSGYISLSIHAGKRHPGQFGMAPRFHGLLRAALIAAAIRDGIIPLQ